MTREETKKIIRIMCDSYPNYKPNNLAETIEVWTMMLEEYTYQQISVALKSYILADTSGFAPSVGQLVAKVQTFTQPQELNEMEAWALVSKAIRNSSYNSVEEYAKLPLTVQKAAGLPDQLRTWATDEKYNEQVAMSQFVKAYKIEVSKQEEFKKLPIGIQKAVQNTYRTSPKAQIQAERDLAIKSSPNSTNVSKIENKNVSVPMPDWAKKEMEEMKENG